jgi:hypothetical protein
VDVAKLPGKTEVGMFGWVGLVEGSKSSPPIHCMDPFSGRMVVVDSTNLSFQPSAPRSVTSSSLVGRLDENSVCGSGLGYESQAVGFRGTQIGVSTFLVASVPGVLPCR